MTRDQIKEYINSHPEEHLQRARKKGYVCPLCHNGTGSDGDGLRRDQTGHFKCFRCGFYGDMIELIAKENGIADGGSREAFDAARAAYGLTLDTPKPDEFKKPVPPAPKPKEPEPDYTAKYAEWHQALLQAPEALAYLEKRGINRATIDALNLGYCPNMGYGEKQSFKAPRIIFPYSADYYKARRIDGGADAKYIPSTGGKHIYNAGAIQDPAGEERLYPIVVVEGELDAAAIYQGGVKRVIALGSTSNKDKFAKQAKQINPAAVYILALDNDPADVDPIKGRAGQKAQTELSQLLDQQGIAYISADTAALYGEYTDAADAAKHDTAGAEFWPRLMGYIAQGYDLRREREREAEREAYYRSGPGMVDLFLQGVKSERYKPLPTGIQTIDKLIGGGLIRQTIVMLGAAPAIGKTALASQIVESIAKAGTADVLYINLEMSREQLLARSLARIAYLNGYHGINTMDILQGYRWSIDTEEAVYEAADEYKATIAQHLLYNPGEDTTDLDAIMEKISAEQRRIGHAPLIVLDYLQLVTSRAEGREADSITTIKKTVQRLKEYAIRENTIAIIITANNRDSMKKNKADLTSGRDSSNIEYGADLHMGMTKDEETDNVILTVNKNRHGPVGDKQKTVLRFNGDCAMFLPLETRYGEPEGNKTI